jgi:hypothetical protein
MRQKINSVTYLFIYLLNQNRHIGIKKKKEQNIKVKVTSKV